jgi:2-polyprenyl-3-methyl-5-hydroxy-6-metoxy-1,4-benzoquinol methylase
MDIEEFVTVAYRALLRRDPDPDALRKYTRALGNGQSPVWLLETFARSDEFIATNFSSYYPHDMAPAMAVNLQALSQDQKSALWAHIAAAWSELGQTDPYWSVLTSEEWRVNHMTDAKALESFYATGQGDLLRLEAWFGRNGLALSDDIVCAEYGCGVGRFTLWLAKKVKRVVAFDISSSHLNAARQYLAAHGVNNVDFRLVKTESDLEALSGVDLFFSVIVLQHNPPPIILDILRRAFAGLNKRGHCFFQVPTYAAGYSFSIQSYLAKAAKERSMEMHFLPQSAILSTARQFDVYPLEIQPDSAIGYRHLTISNTFLMTKS